MAANDSCRLDSRYDLLSRDAAWVRPPLTDGYEVTIDDTGSYTGGSRTRL